jgi:DNA-binding Lrp family transcriptional regulator
LIDEAKLGLKSYSVVAPAPVGREEASGCALTSFPLWRYLAVVDGWRHGNYVRYTIPPDKERDLVAFLNELVGRELISSFEIIPTSSPEYPLLDLDFYLKKESVPVFDWQNWIKSFDSFMGEEIVEKADYEKAEFDLIDLLILRCLELNARMSQRKIVQEIAEILKEKNHKKFIPLVSRRIRKKINPQELIKGCRAYLFPNQGSAVLFFMLHLAFSNNTSLQRFEGALEYLPYNTAYEKILGKNALFVRIIIPTYEYSNMRESLARLAQEGSLKDAHLLLGDLAHGTWDNVEIHQMFIDGTWNFSYGAAIKMLEARVRY